MSPVSPTNHDVIFTGLGLHLLGSAFYLQAVSFTRFWWPVGVFAVAGLLLALAQRGQARRRRLHRALREKGTPSAPLPDAAYLALLSVAAALMVLPIGLWLGWQGDPGELDLWLGAFWLGWTGLAGLLFWLRWKEAQMLDRGARLLDPGS